jgi:hypothetical protein
MPHILTIANTKDTQHQEHAWPHGLEIEIPILKSKPFQPFPKHIKNPNLEFFLKKINYQVKPLP